MTDETRAVLRQRFAAAIRAGFEAGKAAIEGDPVVLSVVNLEPQEAFAVLKEAVREELPDYVLVHLQEMVPEAHPEIISH